MQNYNNLVAILLAGEKSVDRTNVGTKRIFDYRMEWDLSEGFPAVTTKTLFWKGVVGELLWFLSGSTNIENLRRLTFGEGSNNKTIWDDNYTNQAVDLGYTNGDLGPVYGKQWRDFGGVDQIAELIFNLKHNPASRRLLVSAWNPGELELMALPPCHYSFQCFVHSDGTLDLKWHQRSVDTFLGLPFNIASYGLLLEILAKLTGLKAGRLIFDGGDVHLYNNHLDQAVELIGREPRALPKLIMPEFENLEELLYFTAKDFKLEGYNPHPHIAAPMAV